MAVSDYSVVGSDRPFEGRIISLRRDELRMSDGSVSVREVVEHPGAVGVVALDEHDNVVLVHQYRHPVAQYLYELPAGLLDVEGEPALTGAQRELFEEAGLVADEWQVLVDLHTSPGMTDEAIRIYLAQGLRDAEEAFEAEHEELTMTVERIPLAEAVGKVFAGEITNAACAAGLLAAAAARGHQLRPASAPWPARPDR